MIFFFWFLLVALVVWYLGALGFIYHIFAFRYPRDITLPMLVAFLIVVIPVSIIAIGYLAEFYGKV